MMKGDIISRPLSRGDSLSLPDLLAKVLGHKTDESCWNWKLFWYPFDKNRRS